MPNGSKQIGLLGLIATVIGVTVATFTGTATLGWNVIKTTVDTKVEAAIEKRLGPIVGELTAAQSEIRQCREMLGTQASWQLERNRDWMLQHEFNGALMSRLSAMESTLSELRLDLKGHMVDSRAANTGSAVRSGYGK